MKKILLCFILTTAVISVISGTGQKEMNDGLYMMNASDPGISASDWPNFRGVDHNGIYSENDFDAGKLSKTAVLWKKNIGEGYSAPSVFRDKLFIIGHEEPNDVVRCLNAKTGKEIWNFKYETWTDYDYPGPRASPTYSGGKIYTLGRGGDLFCLNADTGKKIWGTNVESYGAYNTGWNYAGSVLISDDMALVNAGKYGMAFNKDTGKLAWKSPEGVGGYATPVRFTFKNKDYLAIFGETRLFAVELKTGKLWWDIDWHTGCEVNAGDPVVFDNKVFIATGYDKGCGVFDFSGGSPKKIWTNTNVVSHFSSFVLYRDRIFAVSGNAGDSRTSAFRCINPADGKVVWEKRLGFASFIMAGDKFILVNESGEVYIFEASASSYKEIKKAQFDPGQYWTAPVMSRGLLYIRNTQGLLTCIDLSD